MTDKLENTKKIANELLLEKYEPILVIKLIRIPPVEELQAFASKIQKDFGYQTLVLCKSQSTEIKELKEQVYKTCKLLEQELETPVKFKTAEEIIEDGKKT